MTDLTANKGEWSEIYAFLKIIAEGRIYGADANSNRKNDIFYDINKVIRNDNNETLEYVISNDGKTAEIKSKNNTILTIERQEFKKEAEHLLETIKTSNRPSFSSPSTQDFMSKIKCYKIKAQSNDKTDIIAEIHDQRTGADSIQGFSIKSKLGHASTLLNQGKTTNMIFVLNGNINSQIFEEGTVLIEGYDKKRTRLSEKFSAIQEKGVSFDFEKTENEIFSNNLFLIDSNMQLIVSEMLKLHYIHGVSSVEEQQSVLEREDPLNVVKSANSNFYRYKIKKLLVAVALGMKPATQWGGEEDANGGYIIVKEDGEVLCYHIYDRSNFEDYLFKNTKLDTPSQSRHGFGEIFKGEDGKYRIKFNLQIRFK